MTIKKFNYVTNEALAEYDTIAEACLDNEITRRAITVQLNKTCLQFDRGSGFYFGYSPINRWVIECYDNVSGELLGAYGSVKEAEKQTGVLAQHISHQCRLNKPFNARRAGSTGLWFKKVKL